MGSQEIIGTEGKSIADRVAGIDWMEFPPPSTNGFGRAKMCYYISSPVSELPVRDFMFDRKREPNYETRTYNAVTSCNQSSICHATARGLSFIVFYTRYQGLDEQSRGKYLVTGLFPISEIAFIDDPKKSMTRTALRSRHPMFVSAPDAIELTDERWYEWFGEEFPEENTGKKKGNTNLKYLHKSLERGSPGLNEILLHFARAENRIDDYIREIYPLPVSVLGNARA